MTGRRRTAVWIAVGVAAFVVGLAIAGSLVPFWKVGQSYCRYCRASRRDQAVLGVRLAPVIRETKFARFWRQEVEPGHEHTWLHCCTREYFTLEYRMGCGRSPAWVGTDEAVEMAVLRDVPTRAERKVLATRLWSPDTKSLSWEARKRLWDKLNVLGDAYRANPHRKDWPAILKKLNLIGP